MNVDFELYKIFYFVAKNKHMTKASNELYITQPAISQAIKKLENQLGGALFIRSNKGMELTKEGEMFYEYVKSAIDLINNAEAEFTSFQKLDTGTLNIGASTTITKIVLLDTIEKFHKDYPKIKINLINELTSNLVLDLQKGKLDFIIYNESNIEEKNIEIEKICELKHGFIYNPDFFTDNITTFAEINNYPLILQSKKSNTRKFIDSITFKNGFELKEDTSVVNQDLLIDFTNIGLGVGFSIIDFALKKYPNLKEFNINKEIPKMSVYIGKNKSGNLTFAAKTFIKYLYDNY